MLRPIELRIADRSLHLALGNRVGVAGKGSEQRLVCEYVNSPGQSLRCERNLPYCRRRERIRSAISCGSQPEFDIALYVHVRHWREPEAVRDALLELTHFSAVQMRVQLGLAEQH